MDNIIPIFLLVVLCLVVGRVANEDGYREGQIDALTGLVRYELVTNANHTVEWEKIEND